MTDPTPNLKPEERLSLADVSVVETQLSELLSKRTQLSEQLATIENGLFNLETSYICDNAYGNIIRGYEGFLSSRTPSSRRQRPTESERIFSTSSVNYERAERDPIIYELAGEEGAYDPDGYKQRRRIGEGSMRKKRTYLDEE